MKTRIWSAVVWTAVTLGMTACGSEADLTQLGDDAPAGDDLSLGNGAPSGSHFNLNIIGVPRGKSASLTGNQGRRIFIALEGTSRILLKEGAEFLVLDANGTDGSASFQLPSPDADGDGVTTFSVFARPLGKPGGSSRITTCATDPVTGEPICSLNTLVSVRTKGKTSFTNVSRQLLFLDADIDGDGVVDRLSLFDPALQDFLWQVDNAGLRLLQLRFYPIATDVN